MYQEKLVNILSRLPRFRVAQIKRAIFVSLFDSWEQVSVLPKELKEELGKDLPLSIDVEKKADTDNQTQKAVLTFDGVRVETVLIKGSEGNNSVCVSVAAGCQLACTFCATGQAGFKRNLTNWEILLQLIFWARELKKENQKITSVVFMGMGEPFLNYEEVKKAILAINDPEGLNIGARKISVSTAGITEGIRAFTQEDWQVNLAFSLHFSNSAERQRYMPVEITNPTREVLGALRDYLKIRRRKIMIEYALFLGINDSPADAQELGRLLKKGLGGLFMVNLLSGNPVGDFKPASKETVMAFRKELEKLQIEVVVRKSRGTSINAACGQLAGNRTSPFGAFLR
jgi:23S rRNA (adenine2503-C2)-methyltransferase